MAITEELTNIANAIRAKTGESGTMKLNQMATKIQNISGGGGLDNTLKGLIERSATEITIPNGVTTIGNSAFSNFTSLTNVTIPNSVTSIGERAFTSSTGLTTITIPNTVTSIGERAFQACSGLTTITIPNSVTSVGNYAFNSCTATQLTIGTSVQTIGQACFSGNKIISLIIPNSVRTISTGAFTRITTLKTVVIPNSITSIASDAFSNCTSLKDITIENGFNANNLYLSSSTLYTAETIVSWLNALNDRTGLPSYTLTIGSTNLAKLTTEQKAIATNKNWTLA